MSFGGLHDVCGVEVRGIQFGGNVSGTGVLFKKYHDCATSRLHVACLTPGKRTSVLSNEPPLAADTELALGTSRSETLAWCGAVLVPVPDQPANKKYD